MPRRRPTAIMIASLSSLRPHVASGSACNQSPLWGAETARSLAVLKLSQKWDLTVATSAAMTGFFIIIIMIMIIIIIII